MAYYFQRRVLPFPSTNMKATSDILLREGFGLKSDIEHDSKATRDYEFDFLNITKEFDNGDIDWTGKGTSKLWRYNLHYFDYIHEPRRRPEAKAHLISHWIANNHCGSEDAWEPYTLSLRIVNWIKFFSNPENQSLVTRDWLASLHQQACWLEQNLEYHILGNHLLKNAKALFFAGMYFDGGDADRWLIKSIKLLEDQANEQILPDGGHFERSPMYHSIVCHDFLDILSLALGMQDLIGAAYSVDVSFYQRQCRALLDFLFDICMPDGDIPLFNDSAFGIAPTPEILLRYGKHLFGYKKKDPAHVMRAIDKKYSGYYLVKGKGDMLIVDAGEIGPKYQPGHAHCDTLSYELCFDNQRIVVDSGVKDYELSATRCYARSTAAHNTIRIDEREQSEIWGAFRVGRRAKPLMVSMMLNDGVIIDASHDGYDYLKKGGVRHQRRFIYRGNTVRVFDSLYGDGTHLIESYLHLHPDLHAVANGKIITIKRVNEVVALMTLLTDIDVQIIKGKYFPEFGREMENTVIHMSCVCRVPVNISYMIEKHTQTEV